MAGGSAALSRPSEGLRRLRAASLRPAPERLPVGTLSLATGEPSWQTPAPISDALKRALDDGYTHYGPAQGDPELIAAIAALSCAQAGTSIDPDSVAITHGGAAAITAAIVATVDPGDRVLLPGPTYSLYADVLSLVGAEAVHIAPGADGRLDLEAIAESAHGARMLILCNPVNPTAMVLSHDELRAAGEIANANDALVLVDEAYADLVHDGVPFHPALSIETLQHNTILVRTFSKTYAMTGWRLGYAVAPVEVAACIRTVHRTMNGHLNPAIQRAGLRALELSREELAPMAQEYARNREITLDRLSALPSLQVTPPEGAFYVWVGYEGGHPSTEVVAHLKTAGVAVRPGSEFGPSGEGHLRLCFATDPDTLREALRRFADGMRTIDG